MTPILDTATRVLVGLDSSHLQDVPGLGLVHKDVVSPWRQLCAAARAEGFALQLVSGYRSFERQLAIFNAKAEGRRSVFDDCGQQVEMAKLGEYEQLQAILRFSALPGTSRHHWGTDMDVVVAAALPPDYRVSLTPEECTPEGVFGGLHQWLNSYLEAGCDFYRPYGQDCGGVAPEPWHLSYAPVADQLATRLTPSVLAPVLAAADIRLKDTVLKSLDSIFERFVVSSVRGEVLRG